MGVPVALLLTDLHEFARFSGRQNQSVQLRLIYMYVQRPTAMRTNKYTNILFFSTSSPSQKKTFCIKFST